MEEPRQERGHLDAVPRQSDRWLEQLGPRQLSVLLVKGLVASQLPGNADPLAACRRQTGNQSRGVCVCVSPPLPVSFNDVISDGE